MDMAKLIAYYREVDPEHLSLKGGGLLESFEEVARQDESGPVMENTQQIYAGLTYGKDSLNEVFLQGDENSRGFRA